MSPQEHLIYNEEEVCKERENGNLNMVNFTSDEVFYFNSTTCSMFSDLSVILVRNRRKVLAFLSMNLINLSFFLFVEVHETLTTLLTNHNNDVLLPSPTTEAPSIIFFDN